AVLLDVGGRAREGDPVRARRVERRRAPRRAPEHRLPRELARARAAGTDDFAEEADAGVREAEAEVPVGPVPEDDLVDGRGGRAFAEVDLPPRIGALPGVGRRLGCEVGAV